ncbi:hypothetical protein DL96DRAFT_1635376 [Flagelloscypha sp. PMI_526]|nr:hypothetical protein DL96DRAFT_1635376 [Flagelloscypha sp. PMI_526]
MSAAPPLSLPFEIIQQILSHIDGKEFNTILASSLVSWSFANACRSRLFGTIKLGSFGPHDVERQKYLADHPNLTALTQCLVLFKSERILPSILAALPNLVELHLYNLSPQNMDRFINNEEINEALVKYIAPKVLRLGVGSTYEYPLSALNDFKSLRSLSLFTGRCIKESPSEGAFDSEISNGGLESISFHQGDPVEEANLVTLHSYLRSRNHKIKQVVWKVSNISDSELNLDTSKPVFCEFFTVHSRTLTSLIVTTCGTGRIALGLIDGSSHPWMLHNLPCLEYLTLPVVTAAHGQWRDEENISWIARNFQSLRTPHPLKRLRLFVRSELSLSLSLEGAPWALLDESLQGSYLSALVSVGFQVDSEFIDNSEFWMVEWCGRAALPSCVKHGLVDAINTSCIW